MRKPRTNILLLTAIFGIVGLVGQTLLARKPASTTLAKPDRRADVAPSLPPLDTPAVAPMAADAPPCLPGPAALSKSALPQQLSDDASILVVEMCDLQLMAQGIDLAMDSKQWQTFASVVLQFQAIRHNYEAMIARLKVSAPGRCQVDIPMYASAGDELREQFTAELRAKLGEPAALEVMTKLGDRLEGCFAGFGVSVQTLDVTASPAGEPSGVQVARTMRYWSNVAGRDCVTTRREIHFPALEDPTGDSWSALLARVDAAGAENGPG